VRAKRGGVAAAAAAAAAAVVSAAVAGGGDTAGGLDTSRQDQGLARAPSPLARAPSPLAALPQLPFVCFGGGASSSSAAAAAAAVGGAGSGKQGAVGERKEGLSPEAGPVASGGARDDGGEEEEEGDGLALEDIDTACEAFLGRRFGVNVSAGVGGVGIECGWGSALSAL